MLTVCWDTKGPIIEDFMKKGTTINSVSYTKMLEKKLKPAIRSKRGGLLPKKVLLLHENARPLTPHHTLETINKMKFQLLRNPPYSPDLIPPDFHFFGPLKDALRGRRFASDLDVPNAVQKWLHDQPKIFHLEGIRKFVECWAKSILEEED
ncbi:Histone-lysine N-methyltransferase SETMAR [Araneus ventricosus]|uniref:Histone-lysine N-methyltransferase SETMAR n=1 Tax=Araneus ventricosus TaxID=182803 RepID=A0A4Y2E619_ARAVE|nr:Histone-lysine N-methyltransferase SETMAR [Araneus ventricosus]